MRRKYNNDPLTTGISGTIESTLIIPKKNFFKNIKGSEKEIELKKDKVYKGKVLTRWGRSEIQLINEQGVLTNYYETSKFIYGISRVREIRLNKILS